MGLRDRGVRRRWRTGLVPLGDLDHQEVISESGALMPWQRTYGYDAAGRLISTAELRTAQGASCITRTYGFTGTAGNNGNRTSLSTYPAAADGTCTTSTTASTTSSSYDAADRLNAINGSSTGISYDAYGRMLTVPAGVTASGAASAMSYYANDFVRSLDTGAGQTRTYGLDPAGRIRSVSATGVAAGAPTSTINHYAGAGGDSPAWTLDTPATGAATIHRELSGLGGDVVAEASTTSGTTSVVWNLDGLHGDVIRTTSAAATGSPDGALNDADEFGVVRDANSATGTAVTTGPKYGWLGGKQRAADTGNAIVLMGARLYAPMIGRFLQRDPEYGGGANTYSYPTDPIKKFDTDGHRWGMPSWLQTVSRSVAKAKGLGSAGWRKTKHWAGKNKFKIAEMGVSLLAGVAAVATAAALCAGTAGVGCLIVATAMARVAYGTVGRAVAYRALGGRYQDSGNRHVLTNALRDLVFGGAGGAVRYYRNMRAG